MQYQTPTNAMPIAADNAIGVSGPSGATTSIHMNDAFRGAPAGSVLMSSAWVRLVGALAAIGVLWLAVAWALAEVGG